MEVDFEISKDQLIEAQQRLIKDLECALERQDRALKAYHERFSRINILTKQIQTEL